MSLVTLGARGRVDAAEPTLLLNSLWDAGTGTSTTALRSGTGQWNGGQICEGNSLNVIEVIPGAANGWNGNGNIFRVTLDTVPPFPGCGQVEWIDVLPESTTHWGRFYYRNAENAMTSVHNFSQNFGVGDPGAIQWVFFNREGVTNGWRCNIRPVHLGGIYPYNVWTLQNSASFTDPVILSDDVWYRFEWMVEYVESNRVRFYVRLYDDAGVLLYDENDFYQQDTPGQGTLTLPQYYALGNSFAVASTDLARNVGIGNEGRNPGTQTGYWDIAAFAISTDGWIGNTGAGVP